MKRSYIPIIVVTIAAAVALASCAKEIRSENKSGSSAVSEGSRVIAVSFAPSTKTALGKDGMTPEFQLGDKIKVALKDGSYAPEDCQVTIENDIAVIHTNLEGDLVAVYPSSAANVKDNFIDGVCVSSKQTGKFADANICSATIPAGSSSASFENKTAVLKFYVDKSINVNSITINGKENVADGSSSITVDGNDENSILFKIAKDLSNERICYVAVLAGTHTALNFKSVTSTQDAPVQKQLNEQTTLATGTMYNVFLPYYIQVGDQKWGYCNVGAFLPEEPGYYFSWGNTQGYVAKYNDEDEDDVEWLLPSGAPIPAGGFTDDNYSKTKGSTLTSNLTATDDAATVAWGGDWRMPTQSEFEALCGLKPGWNTYNGGTQYGRLVGDLFFPTVGRGIYEKLEYPNKKSYYWSSTINDDSHASYFNFTSSGVNVSSQYSRSQGFAIRPIYGTSAPKLMPEILPGVFTVGPGNDKTFGTDDDVKVNFLRGNLWWQKTTDSWHIEDHQYDVPETYNREHLGLFYYFADATLSNYGTKDITKITSIHNDPNLYENYGAIDPGSNHDYFAESADWGIPYGKGHTMTYDEWGYLLSFDKNKSQYLLDDDPDDEDLKLATDYSNNIRVGRYKEKVEVVGHIGMLLVPDVWDLTKNPLDKTSYSETEWAKAESNGAVFLPYVYGDCNKGKMIIMPSQEYYQLYLEMKKEEQAKDPNAEIPEYSDLIMSYFFCQGRKKTDEFLILSTLMTGVESVMMNWYGWDMVASMRLVEYVK